MVTIGNELAVCARDVQSEEDSNLSKMNADRMWIQNWLIGPIAS